MSFTPQGYSLRNSGTIIGNQQVDDQDFNEIKEILFTGVVGALDFEPLLEFGTATDYSVPVDVVTRVALSLQVIENNVKDDIELAIADDSIGTNKQTLIPPLIFSANGNVLLEFDFLFVVPAGKFIGVFNNSNQPKDTNTVVFIREIKV